MKYQKPNILKIELVADHYVVSTGRHLATTFDMVEQLVEVLFMTLISHF